ncbi:MAG TPA: branched-chain amino acid ABC transporter permease [Burkholderiaceae bacterium]|nr:branched-chain amino acid ABC transporter permease [Burkholderiaceae bacterium]
MEFVAALLANTVAYGLVLFLVCAGLTIAFSFMGTLSFAHGAFYALGAYIGFSVAAAFNAYGFWLALLVSPIVVGVLGSVIEVSVLRAVRPRGHMAELLATFGVGVVIIEAIPFIWGRSALPSYAPQVLEQSIEFGGWRISALRAATCGAAVLALLVFAWIVTRTRAGLVLRAAQDQPLMVECAGINLPRWQAVAFGVSAALAAFGGVLGGNLMVIEPSMAAGVTMLGFIVIVTGGLGSLRGAFIASMLVALVSTFAAVLPGALLGAPLSRWAPAAPLLLMIGVLLVRGEHVVKGRL